MIDLFSGFFCSLCVCCCALYGCCRDMELKRRNEPINQSCMAVIDSLLIDT